MQHKTILTGAITGLLVILAPEAIACASHNISADREFTDSRGVTTKKFKILVTNICEFPVLYTVVLKCGADTVSKTVQVAPSDANQSMQNIATTAPTNCGSSGTYVQR